MIVGKKKNLGVEYDPVGDTSTQYEAVPESN